MAWAARALQWTIQQDPPLIRAGNLLKFVRDWDRSLQLLIVNEEFLVRTSHHLVLIMSLPFVHTARRFNRLDDPAKWMDKVLACEQTSILGSPLSLII